MSIHRRITAAVAVLAALALGTSAISASARTFDQTANGSFVPAPTPTSAPVPPILPRATAPELRAIAQAERQKVTYAPAQEAPYSSAEMNAYAATRPSPSGAVGVSTPQIGFDWGDAGIGAAAGFATAVLSLGGAVLILGRRARRHRDATVPS